MEFGYYTLSDLKRVVTKRITGVRLENKWIVVELETGLRIKIRNWKTNGYSYSVP